MRTRPILLSVTVAAAVIVVAIAARRWEPARVARVRSAENGPEGNRVPVFRDVAQEAGIDFRMVFLPKEQGEKFKINLYDHGCGVVVGDYDGDGFDDLYFLNQLGEAALFLNRRDGTFRDVTEEAGVALPDRVTVGATFGDYDNDGDQDLYVTLTRGGNVLFQNQDGRFVDVTETAGLTCVAHSQTAAFFDSDGDGHLDLLVTNTAGWTGDRVDPASKYDPGVAGLMQLAASTIEHNCFYRNNGDGTFADITAASGLSGRGWGGDAAICDFDEDGDGDVLITNMFGQSQLYRNDGQNRFLDTTRTALAVTSWGAIGAKWLDFNNDGRFDLLVTDMHSDMWIGVDGQPEEIEPKRKYRYATRTNSALEQRLAEVLHIRYDDVVFGNTLFENVSPGRFQEVSDRLGVETFWPWGIASGDFDNDGWEDAFLASGMGYPWFYWPNSLLMNQGGRTFRESARRSGTEPPREGEKLDLSLNGRSAARSSRSAAVVDADADGRLEIVVNNFNDRPYLFKNSFPRRNFVSLRLRGTASNRDAIGAVVKLRVDGETLVRQVQAAGGYLSQSSKTVHFGLGTRAKIDHLEVLWPSGIRQGLRGVDINRLHEVIEPAKRFDGFAKGNEDRQGHSP